MAIPPLHPNWSTLVCHRWEWAGDISSPFSNNTILREQCHLSPEIQSFEKCYTGWVKTMLSNFLLVDQSTQDYIATKRSVCNFQCTFLIDDILFHSSLSSRKLSKIGSQISCFSAPNFKGEEPHFWPSFSNYTHFLTCGKVWWQLAMGHLTLRTVICDKYSSFIHSWLSTLMHYLF